MRNKKQQSLNINRPELDLISGGKNSSEPKIILLLKKSGFMNILLFSMISFISINIINSIFVEVRLLKQKDLLLNDYQITEKEHQNLKKEIAYYNSDKGIEKIARERLGFIKQDEVPVRYLFSK